MLFVFLTGESEQEHEAKSLKGWVLLLSLQLEFFLVASGFFISKMGLMTLHLLVNVVEKTVDMLGST